MSYSRLNVPNTANTLLIGRIYMLAASMIFILAKTRQCSPFHGNIRHLLAAYCPVFSFKKLI